MNEEINFWISLFKAVFYSGGIAAFFVGLLSFISPKKSIQLYQAIMKWFNWRVEPILWDEEVKRTRWAGLALIVLALASLILLFNKI